MTPQNLTEAEEILRIIRKDVEGKFGIICLNCLMVRSRFKEIYDFMKMHNIPFPEGEGLSKLDLLDYISIFFYKQYQKSPTLKKQFKAPIMYIGDFITSDEMLSDYLFEIFLEGSMDFILNRPDKEDGTPDYHPLDSKRILKDPKDAYFEISGKIAEIRSRHYGEL